MDLTYRDFIDINKEFIENKEDIVSVFVWWFIEFRKFKTRVEEKVREFASFRHSLSSPTSVIAYGAL